MIEQIIRRPVSVVVATLAVCALGAFSLLKLPLALLPTIERPSLVITARADASSRDEMLHEVTEPIERRLPSVAGITSIESETTDGESRIVVGSAWQTDSDRLRIDVARRIEGAAGIPLDELVVETSGADTMPVIEVAVMGGSGATRTRIAQRVLLPELARIEGAGRIEVIGATPLRVTVEPHAAALAARALTAADVEERLRTAGRTMAAGRVKDGAAVRPLVVAQPVKTLDDLRALLVRDVPLGELATIALKEVADETEFRTADAPGVLLRVHRAPNANAVALARAVRGRIDDLTPRMRNVQLRVVADRSSEVTRALAELVFGALAGVLLGTLILRWILGHWRPTLALAVVVPVALLASFTAFYATGIPLDVISLAGLALATGLLVDNSIVVLESIETARDVARGTRQIIVAVVASSITLVVVFAPLLYLKGLARAIFGEQAIAVVASVAASLLLSLTLTPVLAQRGGIASSPRNPGQRRYLELLQRALERPRRAIAIAVVATLLTIATGWLLPHELFARGAAREVVIEMPAQLRFDLWARVRRAVTNARSLTMTKSEELQSVTATFASTDDAERAAALLRRELPGAEVRLRGSAIIEAVGGDARGTEVVLSAPTEAEVANLEKRLLATVKTALPPQRGRNLRETALFLQWDEARLASNGVDRRSLERDVRAALGELDAGRADIGIAESEIHLLPTRGVVPVRLGGAIVPLTAAAGVRIAERAPVILHDDGRPARRLLLHEPPAVQPRGTERIRIASHARELADAQAQLRLAAILAVILLYLTVAAFYESLLVPLLVMAALPFAAGGGLLSLLVTGQSLNIMSIIGLIFLGGVVVNHTVVLIDRAEQLRRAGIDELEAIRRAAADRYRPVMMTTVTAILGMLPLALIGGDGVELRRAVAIVVIGGLVTATAGTLLLIPLLHRAIEPLRRRGGATHARLVESEAA